MAKTQVMEWKAFMAGNAVEKSSKSNRKFNVDTALKIAGVATVALAVATHGMPAFANEAVTAMAPSFQHQLSAATAPIKDIIFGFAHEIYFVFMAWGAMEALIGKPQQGFMRMKTSTAAYVLLYWVPTIVNMVNGVLPAAR